MSVRDDRSDLGGGFSSDRRSAEPEPQAQAGAQAGRPEGPAADAVLVLKGNYTAIGGEPDTASLPEANPKRGLTGRLKRMLADRARALVSETCGDMPEAAKLASCGVYVRAGINDVTVEKHPDGYAYASGLQTCGSVWACPICSFKIRMKRAAELAEAIAEHRAQGGTQMLLTLTTQHSFGESLDEVWADTQDTWSYITGHSRYRKLKERLGLGFCRTVETMHGLNGWHPHLHVVLFSDTPIDMFDDRELWNEIIVVFHDLWVNRMRSKFGRECRSSVAVDLRPIKTDGVEGAGMYCTKAGYEVAMADGKEGRTSTSRHPFAIAFDAVETGDCRDIALFREWIKGSHDRRMWTWSKGLRQRLGLDVEKTDEELAAEADETVGQICIVSKNLWKAMVRTRVGVRAAFLTALDQGADGLPEALDLLEGHGLEVVVEPRGTSPPRLRLASERGRL